MAVQNSKIDLKKKAFPLCFKKRSVIAFLCSFEKSCLSQKLFVTHSSEVWCLMNLQVQRFIDLLIKRLNPVSQFSPRLVYH